jgi:MFS family permease
VSPFDGRYLLGLATTLCNLALVAIYPLLPESPRWLLGKVPLPLSTMSLAFQGKYKEAAEIIRVMRSTNGDPVIANLEERLQEVMPVAEVAEAEGAGLTAFVRRSSLLRVGLCMATIWSVNDYFYIAGSMNVENLAGDMFVNFSLLSLTELPSVFIGQTLIDRWGRRWVHLGCMAITTLAFASIVLLTSIDPSLGTAVIVLSVLSKLASNVGWFIMWVQCIEVFPTPLRGTGMNLCVMISTVISMTGPFVVDLGSIDLRYPFIIFTGLGVVGILTTSLVPETKDVPLPERLEDVDRMVNRFRFWQLRPWRAHMIQRSVVGSVLGKPTNR